MDYTSIAWLAWIAVTTGFYWGAPKRMRIDVVVLFTVIFMLSQEWLSVVWLAAMTAVTYAGTRGTRPDGRRAVLAAAPVAIVLLGYKVLSVAQGDDLTTDALIPLGLSYYSLRCIHYSIERYKGTIRDLGPRELVGYLFFLPTIFVGPIHRFPEWRRDQDNDFDATTFAEGLERILHGFVKIAFLGNFVVSDVFDGMINRVTDEGTAPAVYLEMIEIGLNLYFQFSGFSDLAIGFSLLLGFRVMENFRWPFLQRNINEFWNSWHISLTSWSRDYVYTATIARFRSQAAGVLATLIAIGLWHEVSLRYLLWGAYHGLGIVIWGRSRSWWARFPQIEHPVVRGAIHVVSVIATVHFVFLGFLLVRQDGVGGMLDTLDVLFTEWGS